MKHATALLALVILALATACTAAPPALPISVPQPSPRPALAASAPSPVATSLQPAPPVGVDGRLVQGTAGQPWWNDTVFYEIFVRSFSDSDGDGIGDLNGLIQKLDYLNDGDPATATDLGVTGIWLMPVAESPSYHGYDVSDYGRVDREYGSNADFKRLIAEAHRRGIRVIVDLVLNHTSSQHPWFESAQDPGSAQRDWYIWSKEQPQGPGWHKGADGWYYGYFWEGMPDLNYRNPAVTAAMHDVARFWLEEMGADGFRLDAVKHLIEDGRRIENTPATHDWLKSFRTFYKGVQPDALTVGEIWSTTDVSARYVGEELDLAFDFPLADATIASALNGRSLDAQRAQKAVLAAYPAGQYATFLANHDQNRTRSRLLDDDQARMAATLQLLFSGVPFIYYGEEIGMSGTKPDENIRRPMQWTASGGFSTGTPWRDYFEDYAQRNVAAQAQDPRSLLSHYRELIRLRNSHEALRIGRPWLIDSDHPAVYAALRSSASQTVLVLLNLSSKPVEGYGLSLAAGPFEGTPDARLLWGSGDVRPPQPNAAGGFDAYQPTASLPGYSALVVQLTP
jgi:glycosidase